MLNYKSPTLPKAPKSIQKGVPLKEILNAERIAYLARNIQLTYTRFETEAFQKAATKGLDDLTLMERAKHIAKAIKITIPENYQDTLSILVDSFTKESDETDDHGLAGFFYLPHSTYIAEYGVSATTYSDNQDPFDASMLAQYELTKRFTAEFSIRPFLIHNQERALTYIQAWLMDSNSHVRRLCTEGTRPRLPWGKRLPNVVKDPNITGFILDALKDDPSRYVQRSVANHLGDIAKDNPEWVVDKCKSWLPNADENLKWLIRHALRYLDKKGMTQASTLRRAAK